jgi:hypothetical protein
MNERIQQLAEQATTYIEPTADSGEGWIFDKEKFAELIVKECAELTLDYKNDQHYQGWLDYRDEIKQHFGVEE